MALTFDSLSLFQMPMLVLIHQNESCHRSLLHFVYRIRYLTFQLWVDFFTKKNCRCGMMDNETTFHQFLNGVGVTIDIVKLNNEENPIPYRLLAHKNTSRLNMWAFSPLHSLWHWWNSTTWYKKKPVHMQLAQLKILV